MIIYKPTGHLESNLAEDAMSLTTQMYRGADSIERKDSRNTLTMGKAVVEDQCSAEDSSHTSKVKPGFPAAILLGTS